MKGLVVFLLVGLMLGTAAWSAEAPVAVSPANGSRPALIGDRCPTFSWGVVDEAVGYELVVYRLGAEGERAEPALRESFAGSVGAWTPSLDRCLERGGRYAWSVRAVARKSRSAWSAPSLFKVAAMPGEAELEAAIRVVSSYIAARDAALSSTPSDGEEKAARRDEPAAAPVPVAPPGTQLAVDGNVDAVSFSGDGSLVTGLDPANLSGAVPVTKGGTGATDAASARTNLGVAAGAHTVDTSAATICDAGEILNGSGKCNADLGLDDLEVGRLTLYGDDTVKGASVDLFNGASEDGVTDKWRIEADVDLTIQADGVTTATFSESGGFRSLTGSVSDTTAAVEGDLSARSVNGYLGVEGGAIEGWSLADQSLGVLGINSDSVNDWGVGVSGASSGGVVNLAGVRGQASATGDQDNAYAVHAVAFGTGATEVRGVHASASSSGTGTVYGLHAEAASTGAGLAVPIHASGAHDVSGSTTFDAHLRIEDAGIQMLIDENEIEVATAAGGAATLYLNFNRDGEVYTGGELRVGSIPVTSGSSALCWDGSGDSLINACTSLRALKTNIRDLAIGRDTFMKLRPRQFDWLESGTGDLGFVAEEVEQVSPTLASYANGELAGVKYRQLTSLITKVVQEQQEVIDDLVAASKLAEARIAELRRELEEQRRSGGAG